MSVTINDIAKEAKVSPSTVSRVLNSSGYVKDDTRKRIESVIKEMNYAPSAIARSLSKKETNTIGVIIPDITNPYFGEVIKGISHVAEKNNLNIIFYNTDNSLEKELKALNILKEQRIKGIIMTPGFGAEIKNELYKETIEKLECPLILACADVTAKVLSGVFVDNVKGAYEATKLLIQEGHRKIGIMLGPLSSEPMSQRLQGYKKALKQYEIKFNDDYVLNGKFSIDESAKLTRKLLNEQEQITALIVYSNRMTIGVIKALIEEDKRIPDDLALIGSDKNKILDVFGLNLTYIDEDPLKLGKKAMEMLCRAIYKENSKNIERTVIVPQIIVKGSEKKL